MSQGLGNVSASFSSLRVFKTAGLNIIKNSFVFSIRNSICLLAEFQSPLVISLMNQLLLKVTFETQSQYDFNKQQ